MDFAAVVIAIGQALRPGRNVDVEELLPSTTTVRDGVFVLDAVFVTI